ncbi:carboxylesterase family protein [Parahaliea maris]|uniref:Carboxylic ester hydrolase n=1 Tax=Parahaliea maris TaxID=2716870 RepID=A0A5C8ZU18_9GAMM|nr:carboxylesterase family protein [Parahaliea maris]TXS91985.1 carboxylesterase family protein [Parahaliea maris]
MSIQRSLVVVLGVVLAGASALSGCQSRDTALPEAAPEPDFSLVTTGQGPVRGVVAESIVAYKGVPYAAAPVGELRWRAPQPAAPREALLVADEYGNRCMQPPEREGFPAPKEAFTQPQSEDCLYLNIYRPETAASDLPVMVWIPGGGLVSGSGARPVNHGGNLAREGVIVVSINYRLGSFGFFAHPELSARNPDGGRLYNYGLMDQIAALQWVRDNISAFGGDPGRVTVFGESAGGASVYALLASPLARGLFSGAIAQSGYGFRLYQNIAARVAPGEASVEQGGVALVERMQMPEASLATLRAQPAEVVVAATDFSNFIQFAVDGVVLEQSIHDTFASGLQAPVPVIVGSTDAETAMVPPEAQRAGMARYLSDAAMTALAPWYGGEALRDTFLQSDFGFHSQVRTAGLAHEKAGNPVYVFRFGMAPEGSTRRELNDGPVYGAPHAADMPYVFGNFTGDHLEPTEPGPVERQVSRQMMAYWTNFAKTGDPNGEGLPRWQQSQGRYTMMFTPDGTESRADNWAARLDELNSVVSSDRVPAGQISGE